VEHKGENQTIIYGNISEKQISVATRRRVDRHHLIHRQKKRGVKPRFAKDE
jgi:hypothetical protein